MLEAPERIRDAGRRQVPGVPARGAVVRKGWFRGACLWMAAEGTEEEREKQAEGRGRGAGVLWVGVGLGSLGRPWWGAGLGRIGLPSSRCPPGGMSWWGAVALGGLGKWQGGRGAGAAFCVGDVVCAGVRGGRAIR